MADVYQSQSNDQTSPAEKARQTRTIWVGVISGMLFTLFGILLYAQGPAKLPVNIWGLGITAYLAVAGFISALMAWRGRTTLAGALLLAALLSISFITPVIGHGQGIALGMIVAILGIGITTTTLPERYFTAGIAVALFTGAIIIILDQVLPDLGIYNEPLYTSLAAVVLTLIFIFVVIRQYNHFTLRAKLVVAFATITFIPLVVLGLYNNYISNQTLTQSNHNHLTSLAATTSESLDDFINEGRNVILTEAKQPTLVDLLLLPPYSRPNSLEQGKATITLQSFQRKDPIFIDSYAILDTTGKDILDTNTEYLGRDESRQVYFTQVIKTGAPYISNVVFVESGEQSLYFSAPIKDRANRIIGVLRAEYYATILQSIVRSSAPNDMFTIIALIDRNSYLRLAYTGNRDWLFKSYKNFSDAELATLQSQGVMPSGTRNKILAGAEDQIVNGIGNLATTQFFDTYSEPLDGNFVNTGVPLKNQSWVVLVRQSYTSENLQAVARQSHYTILLSLALAGIAILLALFSAQILAAPLVSLSKVAEQVAAGDISARATINTRDEIGQLATSFNRMTEELNITLNSLEERIAERTADIEITQRQSEKRANELEAISEISKVIASEQNLETLLPLISRLVSERFGFYHTGIFMVDETRQYAVLQAANSEGGRRMLARGHKLELGRGIVGYVTQSGMHRIALDVGLDSIYFNNPDLPTTRSEMALPLMIRNQVIGALDVQSEKANAFTETDAKNLSILADQISIAIENARLFDRTQQALNEMQTLYRQNLQESWVSFSIAEPIIGYQQTIKGGKRLSQPVETEEIRQVINRGATLLFNTEENAQQEPAIIVPIKLRGQVIGTLNAKAPAKGRQWTKDEVNLVEMVSERLSIALENARLIEESQRQVVKQQTIRDMTEKISTSINLKNVLQTAVEELGRVMPGSEIVLKLTAKDDQDQSA